ncbi:MAG: glutamate--tRNA ligase [Bacteroidales bacterium]|nr:glutamate--tRNA ligase [Bacteroidales bacterium]
MSKVRVRFAPSPTGPLHIGGLRTALFNYLFARKHGGTFILRIEDTDQARYVAEAENYILASLEWCGIGPDEGVGAGGDMGPYRQSERKERYAEYADRLVRSGHAYLAFDTPEELDQQRSAAEAEKQTFTYDATTRNGMNNSLTMDGAKVQQLVESGTPYVVRFKFPPNEEIVMQDIVRGEVRVESRTLDDKILFKSDGMPTYHLANVVDDHEMEITHVIRGEEWLPSLPLHVSLYKAFGWTDSMPQFAHLPLILKPDGKGKLSKRDGDKGGFPVFPLEWKDPKTGEVSSGYREEGYFPEACINILAFLGWNPGTEKELYSLEELPHDFDLQKVGKAGAKFDHDKARWFNHQYLQQAPGEELATSFEKVLAEKGVQASPEMVLEVVQLVRERADFVSDLWEQSSFFFRAPESYDEKVVKKRWKESTPELMRALSDLLQHIDPFTAEHIEREVKAEIEAREWGMGAVMNAWRLLLVGAAQGPSLFHIAEILGKEEVLKRIETGINRLS